MIEAVAQIDETKANMLTALPLNVLKDKLLYKSSWHHTSSMYNRTDFYAVDEDVVEDLTQDAVNEWRNIPPAEKPSTTSYRGAIDYIEWTGTRKHPKANKQRLDNVNIEERGSFYIVTDNDGREILRKKIGSNGTYVTNYDEQERQKKARAEAALRYKNNSAPEAYAFYKMLQKDGMDRSTSGHMYEKGRKPSRGDYALGLENFFRPGEQRLYDDAQNERYELETWNGTEWEKEDVKNETKYSRALDQEYMAAVREGDEETEARLVEQAARSAGYDSPKLYHGTGAFGFTEFDLKLGENLIFAASNREVSESYVGKSRIKRIAERKNISSWDLRGNYLLTEYQKEFGDAKNLRLVDKQERNIKIDELQGEMIAVYDEIEKILKNTSLSAEETDLVRTLMGSLETMATATTDEEFNEGKKYWDYYEGEIKSGGFDAYDDEYVGTGEERKNVDYRKLESVLSANMGKIDEAEFDLSRLFYNGDLYVQEGENTQDYIYDNMLQNELNRAWHKGIYQLYGKLGKSLEIDANGAKWYEIPAPNELGLTKGKYRTRTIGLRAFELGYDSVVIRNLLDVGGMTDYNETGDVYIFNAKNEVKSADPVTYDDEGEVIPLSERFNSEKEDIRWSRELNNNAIEYVERLKSGSRQRWEMLDILEDLAEGAYPVEGARLGEKDLIRLAKDFLLTKEGPNENVTAAQARELAQRLGRADAMLSESERNVDTVLYGLYKILLDDVKSAGHYWVQDWAKEFRKEFKDNGKLRKVYIPESVRTDVTEHFGGEKGFRQEMRGIMKIVTEKSADSVDLDEFYEELRDKGYALQETTQPSGKILNILTAWGAGDGIWYSASDGMEYNGLGVEEVATDRAYPRRKKRLHPVRFCGTILPEGSSCLILTTAFSITPRGGR